MTSKKIIILHTFIFATLALSSIIFPIIKIFYPGTFQGRYMFIAMIVAVVILIKIRDNKTGECPMTVWENRHRALEQPSSKYTDPCLNHYAFKWFNIKLSRKAGRYLIMLLAIFPAIIGILKW